MVEICARYNNSLSIGAGRGPTALKVGWQRVEYVSAYEHWEEIFDICARYRSVTTFC
jgi:hypothetical protein